MLKQNSQKTDSTTAQGPDAAMQSKSIAALTVNTFRAGLRPAAAAYSASPSRVDQIGSVRLEDYGVGATDVVGVEVEPLEDDPLDDESLEDEPLDDDPPLELLDPPPKKGIWNDGI